MYYPHGDVILIECLWVFFINSGIGAYGVTNSRVDSVCPASET